MTTQAKKTELAQALGLYMYCIIEEPKRTDFGLLGMGTTPEKLQLVREKDLACVVSASPNQEYPVTRENSMTHQKAIEEVMKDHAVLPVRFSTIATNEEAIIEKVLKPRYQEFKDLLRWVSDKTEVGLKVYWLEMPSVFASLTQENTTIQQKTVAIKNKPSQKTYLERIEIGKMVESALKQKKESIEKSVLDCLKSVSAEYKRHDPYGDNMILSAAFLVKRSREEEFFLQIKNFEKAYGDNMKFKYVHGAPPFNFVNIVIRWNEE